MDQQWLQRAASRQLERAGTGQALYWAGDSGSDVFCVASGTVRLLSLSADGRRMIAGFALAGEFFSGSVSGVYAYTAEAVTPCQFRRFRLAMLDDGEDGGHSGRTSLMEAIQLEPWKMQAELMRALHKPADESVAYFILSLGRRQNPSLREGSRILLDMSRVDIADHLGLTVETVCRGIKRLERDGVIRARGPHEITVADMRAMRSRAGEGRDI